MSGSVANTLWARSFADELARVGVREVVVAPGSRSTPLVMAFAADGRFRTRVHLDERSAAYFALGVGKASGRPAVVVTTSGTAVANVFPAVVEASLSGVPMLVLTADRPHRLRDSDANQAIDQVQIYGGFVRAFHDVAPPTVERGALRHLRGLANRAYATATGPDAGPVHLNFPFDKPLEPASGSDLEAELALAGTGRPDDVPFTDITVGRPAATPDQLEAFEGVVGIARGVIVAGPSEDADRLGKAVLEFAAATGFPVLADPLSGARFGPTGGAYVVAAYDLFLRDDAVRRRLAPGVIVRVGASPTSAALQGWLEHHSETPHVVIDGSGRWKDHGSIASHYVRADPADTLARLAAGRVRGEVGVSADAEWVEAWRVAEAAALRAIAENSGGEWESHEGDVLAAVLRAVPAGANLFVSSSMPIRDLDAFGHPTGEVTHVFANRGASGIDGILSTAFGVASQRSTPTVCVVGDIAFFHDQNGLLWSREDDASVVFVLIDNDGGGIFHRLPIAEHEPHFTRFFATPHGIELKHAAAAHGIDFTQVGVTDIGDALARALSDGRTQILCVRTDREVNHRRHLEVEQAVARSVREALG